MKNRFLITMAFMLIIVCGIFLVNKVMAVTCYELESEDCTTDDQCYERCTPSCSTGRISYAVDKCKSVCSGYYTCGAHPTDELCCYKTYDCDASTYTCPSDASEKQCEYGGNDEKNWISKKILSDSGCSQ
jgi:hypothetical protein